MDLNYIFKYHLLKPLYMLQFNNEIRTKKVILDESLCIGEGWVKKVYLHPKDKSKCIKILKKKNKILWNDLHDEFRFFKLYSNKPKYITKFYGLVKTNKGLGLVYETVLDYNGERSDDLSTFIKNKLKYTNQDNIYNLKKKLIEFNLKFIKKYKTHYRQLNNIFIRFVDEKKYEFVVIDDFIYYNHKFKKKKINKLAKFFVKEFDEYLK